MKSADIYSLGIFIIQIAFKLKTLDQDTVRDQLTAENQNSRSVFHDSLKEINHKGQSASVITLLDIAIECCQTESKRLDINAVHAKE